MQYLKSFLSTVGIIASMHAYAESRNMFIGVDILNNHMSFKKNYDTAFKKNTQALNLFCGYRFLENFFAEVGYEFSNNKKKTITAFGDQYWLGVRLPHGYNMNYQTKIKSTMPYIGLGASYDILPTTYVDGLVGVGITKIKAFTELLSTNLLAVAERDKYRHYKKNKGTPIIRLSLTQKLDDDFGVRVFGAWKMTNVEVKPKEPAASTRLKLKNSYSFGLGVFYNLPI